MTLAVGHSRREQVPDAAPADVDSGAQLDLLVTVTFNDNQLRAHLAPILCLPQVRTVTLVTDAPAPALPKLRAVVPPRVLARVLGRAGAKLVVCLLIAWRERPDWVIGYNLVPHGINAFLVARLTRRKSLYHMIGGPIEWEGGGWLADNRITGRLPRPSPALERLLLGVISRCTAVVTMGYGGRRSLVERGISPAKVVAIPPSVAGLSSRPPRVQARYQLVMVAQLIPRKEPRDFLRAVAALRKSHPTLRAALVGDGPLAPDLRRLADRLDIAEAVDFLGFRDPLEIYAASEVFTLTSRAEGLPVAIIEAMACGLPVVVSDVGDVRDLVRDEENGYVFPQGDIDLMAERIALLLGDADLRARLGEAARRAARAHTGIERVSALYLSVLSDSAWIHRNA